MTIRILPQVIINRIAAGEVIERPASAIKELVENSIDAGARNIEITVHNAGRNYICVNDDGTGMDKDELELCVERHATSKLSNDDLFKINSFGFRGEALPSIGSVSRLKLTSKKSGADDAWSVFIEGGEKHKAVPASISAGTKIEIRDLFFATPARLKFLKTERTELQHIQDIINRLSMANPEISFTLKNENKTLISVKLSSGDILENTKNRLGDILGQEFKENSLEVNSEYEDIKVTGFCSLPTFSRNNAAFQYLFVNKRPIKDKVINGAVRVAYDDYLARDRHPVLALFIEIDPEEIDVNVHPAKTEIRFRQSQKLRSAIIKALKDSLSTSGYRASTTIAQEALNSFKSTYNFQRPKFDEIKANFASNMPQASVPEHQFVEPAKIEPKFDTAPSVRIEQTPITDNKYPLGAARCQLHDTYIVAQTENSIVIVDQHAAHERIVYEEMKKTIEEKTSKRQKLLIPEVVELQEAEIDGLINNQAELEKFGFMFEKFGENAVIINETPNIIGNKSIKELIRDIASDILEIGSSLSLKEKIEHIIATIACHGSIRAGRALNVNDMNQLLRDMEKTPFSGQCNHGRPTYVELELKDIEKLFGRR